MIKRKSAYEKILIIMIIFLIPLFSNMIITSSINRTNSELQAERLKTSRVEYHLNESWIKNPTFDNEQYWQSRIEGDSRDVSGNISLGQANYKIIGDSGEMQIDDPLNNIDWQDYNNPEFPISPDTNGSSSAGLYITHEWDENVDQTRNTPSIHWKRTITMPVNMSDYIITDASLEVIFNASVTAYGSVPNAPQNGGIERPGDYTDGDIDPPPGGYPEPPQFGIGDFATFYVLISDVDNHNSFMVGINQTTDLGQDSPEVWNYTDTLLDVVPKNILISYLNSILQYDNFNFTVTLGIDVYCEDNDYNVDVDTWDMLIMRSFNLTFSFEKKVDQHTSFSWEQVGNAVNGTNVQVTEAIVNFKYKIDQPWPSSVSPNSEIRVLFNNNSMAETVKLSVANNTFQLAKEGGYDVTSLILTYVNITVSFQVYMADEFGLFQNITISIDDVSLRISYIEVFPEFFTEPWVFAALLVFASVATAGLGGYFIAYQRVLKYPRPVRKVMKYKRTLRRAQAPEVAIMPRDIAFDMAYNHELAATSKLLKIKTIEAKKPVTAGKEAIEEPSDKLLEKKIDSEELISKSLEKKEELDKLVQDSTGEASKTDKS
ncbi:MAG: hypothetical protein ACFE9S_00385 [Candidatus Hermodarchaeota archaeon]